jgi:hypothetical protein
MNSLIFVAAIAIVAMFVALESRRRLTLIGAAHERMAERFLDVTERLTAIDEKVSRTEDRMLAIESPRYAVPRGLQARGIEAPDLARFNSRPKLRLDEIRALTPGDELALQVEFTRFRGRVATWESSRRRIGRLEGDR